MGRSRDERGNFGIGGGGSLPVGPGHDAPAHASFDAGRIDFGHYAGQTIAELAERDPDYLRWLARHPSGARYRAQIERVLGRLPIVPGT
jgi:hypothetical protein